MNFIECIHKLNSLQKAIHLSTKETTSNLGSRSKSLEQMTNLWKILGHSQSDLSSFPIIHVTGTKGKGNTCNFISQILKSHRPSQRIGLYTSPHLKSVRERIKIDGVSISEECFSTYFTRIWTKISHSGNEFPGYFRFLTLLAFEIFVAEKIDFLVLEVGIGGKHDCTNIVPSPVVCVLTNIGYDHLEILGNTLEEICSEKIGIVKEGSKVVISSFQTYPQVIPFLQQSIAPKEAILSGDDDSLNLFDLPHVNSNAVTAMKACELALGSGEFQREIAIQAVKSSFWPGRNQIVTRNRSSTSQLTFYLDGAHTKESLELAKEWFFSRSVRSQRILCFNCTGPRILKEFYDVLTGDWTLVAICSIFSSSPECSKPSNNMERDLQNANSIENAVYFASAREFEQFIVANWEKADVLVTGSLHLVGSFLEHFENSTTEEQSEKIKSFE